MRLLSLVQTFCHLLNKEKIVMNSPSLDKSRLVYRHQIRQHGCKAIGHELSNQFGKTVDKACGPEVSPGWH